MAVPTIVYVYGPSGYGKSSMLRDVIRGARVRDSARKRQSGKRCPLPGTIYDGYYVVVDGFTRAMTQDLVEYAATEDRVIVLCSNEMPDDVNIHLEHVFWVGTEAFMEEARRFLEGIA